MKENSYMTSKKSSRKPKASSTSDSASSANGSSTATPASMVSASESAWSGVSMLGQSKSAGLSRNRMIDARGDLLRSEREFTSLAVEAETSMSREAEAMERKAIEIRAEAWAIEQEAQTRLTVLRAQARMESELAKHITDIAERSALSVLDRIKEASDSLMDWAGLIGEDMTGLLKQEAADHVERTVAEIRAIEEALGEEDRATELLELTARYQKYMAA